MLISRTDIEQQRLSRPSYVPSRHLHLQYIDCARGYAVLMVIACHLTRLFPALPWPVRRLMMSGWFGVQLFFLASCLTLLMSWHAEAARHGRADPKAFFLRRFFRIAPAYYLAGVLYFLIDRPAGGFDALQALRSAIFINAWQPDWIPVTPGWIVVPGGWSIGVEFTFYALFPLFAVFVTNLGRAALVFAACVAVGAAANIWGAHALASLSLLQKSNFLYFWFPNQACVFALGGVLYFVLRNGSAWRAVPARRATSLSAGCVLAFCALSAVPLGRYIGDGPGIPAFLIACPILFGFLVSLSAGSRFVNRAVAGMGKLSFSAYLLHFAVLSAIGSYPGLMHTHAAGYAAIAASIVAFAVAVVLTFGASFLSYHLVEQPMVRAGKRVIAWACARNPAGAGFLRAESVVTLTP